VDEKEAYRSRRRHRCEHSINRYRRRYLLRDNPVSFPVQDGKLGMVERPAVAITVALPVLESEAKGE